MRSHVPSYNLESPGNLREVLKTIAAEPGVWRPFAGGTDLMVLLEAGKLPHKNYLNIWNLTELRGIEVTDQHVTLGALTTYTEVQQEKLFQIDFPMLCQAASETGGLAIQNRGTLGGNIVNASPAADSPPALLAYDAELELVSLKGARWVPYHGFHTAYKQMIIRPDELLTRIRLPRRTEKLQHYYRKVGTRKAQAISKVCFAGTAQVREEKIQDVRIALGSIAPVPLRCVQTEDALRGSPPNQIAIDRAMSVLANEIVPIDDIRSTSNYRHQVSLNLVADFLQQLRA
ncbi:MAG: xanthine dehydrogenase family protein subunit M [Blastocatellia bacterium]|nr:xanthine dehydrogenase family protein subunit M [Blastocatellia bacterium]